MVYLYKGNRRAWLCDFGSGRVGDPPFSVPISNCKKATCLFPFLATRRAFLSAAPALRGLQSLPLASPYPSSTRLCKQGPNSSRGASPGTKGETNYSDLRCGTAGLQQPPPVAKQLCCSTEYLEAHEASSKTRWKVNLLVLNRLSDLLSASSRNATTSDIGFLSCRCWLQ